MSHQKNLTIGNCADEPTGNLDPETTNDIMDLLMEISSKGKTILMATHNYNLILKYPSRIIRCDGGTVIDKKVEN